MLAAGLVAAVFSSVSAQEFTRTTGSTNDDEISWAVAPPHILQMDFVAIAGYHRYGTGGPLAARVLDATFCADWPVEVDIASAFPEGNYEDIVFDEFNGNSVAAGFGTPPGAGANSMDAMVSVNSWYNALFTFSIGSSTLNEKAEAIIQVAQDYFVIAGRRWDETNTSASTGFITLLKITNSSGWSAAIVWEIEVGTVNTFIEDIVYNPGNNSIFAVGGTEMPGASSNFATFLGEYNVWSGAYISDVTIDRGLNPSQTNFYGQALDYDSGCNLLYLTGYGTPSNNAAALAYVMAVDATTLTTVYDYNFLPANEFTSDIIWNPVRSSVAITGFAPNGGNNDGTLLEMEFCPSPNSPTTGYGTMFDATSSDDRFFALGWVDFWNTYLLVGGSLDAGVWDHFHVSHDPSVGACPSTSYGTTFTQLSANATVPNYNPVNTSFSMQSIDNIQVTDGQNAICQPSCRTAGHQDTEAPLEANEMSIYPNPVSSTLTVQCTGNWESDLFIYDVKGALVKTISNPELTMTVDLTGLKSGIYLIRRMTSSGKVVTEKFTKE